MNEVNFLPQRYIERRARRLQHYRQGLLMAVAVAMLIGWGLVQYQRTDAVRRYADHLDVQVDTAERQLEQVTRLRKEHKALVHQIHLRYELAMPVEHTQVLALISDRMPKDLGLLSVEMTTHRPKPLTREQIEADQDKKHRRKKLIKAPVSPRDEIDIQLRGVAPEDAVLTDFVERIEASGLFSNVRIHSSLPGEFGDLKVREFSLSLRVPLNRRIEPTVRRGEVADAR